MWTLKAAEDGLSSFALNKLFFHPGIVLHGRTIWGWFWTPSGKLEIDVCDSVLQMEKQQMRLSGSSDFQIFELEPGNVGQSMHSFMKKWKKYNLYLLHVKTVAHS